MQSCAGGHAVADVAHIVGAAAAGIAAGDDQRASGALIGAAAGAAVEGEAQGNAAGEGFVRHKAQIAEIVIPVGVIAVAKGIAVKGGTGEGRFVPLAVAGVDSACTGVICTRPVKGQVFEGAGAAALVIELLEIVLVEGDLAAGFDGIGDVSLGGGGAGFAAGDFQSACGTLIGTAAGAAVEGEAQSDAAGGEGLIRYEAQVAEIVIAIGIITVAERIAVEGRAGEGRFIPLAVAGIDGAVGIFAGAGAVKDQIFEGAGAAALVIELLEIVLVKGNFVTGLDGIGDVSPGGGGAGFAAGDFQSACSTLIGAAAGAAVEGEAQGDAAGGEGTVRYEAQVAEIVIAIGIIAVTEGSAAEIGAGESNLFPRVITGIDGAVGVFAGAGTVKLYIFERAGAAAVIVELLKIVLVKGHFLAGLHGIADGTALGGAGTADIDTEDAFQLSLLIAVQGEGQLGGLTVCLAAGRIVHPLDAVFAGILNIAFGSIKPGIVQIILVYAYLVAFKIHGVHSAVGIHVGQVGKLHAVEVIAFVFVIIILEIAELQGDVIPCVHLILNIRRRFCGCHGNQRRDHDQSHQKRRDALFQKSTHKKPPKKSELCYPHA